MTLIRTELIGGSNWEYYLQQSCAIGDIVAVAPHLRDRKGNKKLRADCTIIYQTHTLSAERKNETTSRKEERKRKRMKERKKRTREKSRKG